MINCNYKLSPALLTVRISMTSGVKRYTKRQAIVIVACVLSIITLMQPACRNANDTLRPTVVYLVRHAEKASSADNNPQLSEAGVRRAEALAQTLGDAGVTTIYTTQFKRTAETAAPLLARTKVGVTMLEVDHDNPQTYVEQLSSDILTKHRGETVVVISHSNTLPLIVERLSGKPVQAIEDDAYSNLYVVTLPAQGAVTIVRAGYGA